MAQRSHSLNAVIHMFCDTEFCDTAIARQQGRLPFRVTSVELGSFATFPLHPPKADVGADIQNRRLVPRSNTLLPPIA